jgi:hypothetical protein
MKYKDGKFYYSKIEVMNELKEMLEYREWRNGILEGFKLERNKLAITRDTQILNAVISSDKEYYESYLGSELFNQV